MTITTLGRAAFVAAIALTLSACGINSVPAAEEAALARWADVEAQHQRRADLIPGLAEIVRGASQNEQTILREVTEARSRATSIQISGDDLANQEAMNEYAAAQSQLGQGLGRLIASFEAYPEIRSNENYLAFQDQFERTQNRITVAIRDYNAAVQEYNTTIRTFPDSIGANIIHGAERMANYEAPSENADVSPEFDLTPDQ